jgi:hypothetical protein
LSETGFRPSPSTNREESHVPAIGCQWQRAIT